jgi:hypothetical protein
MKVVHSLGEAASGLFIAILVENVDLDVPLFHREALHDGGLVAAGSLAPQFPPQQFLSRRACRPMLLACLHVVLFGDDLDLAL